MADSVAKPLIPAHLVAVAFVLGGALFAASEFVPAPYNLLCAGLGSVALYLSGKGLRMPAWAAGKPLLPATLVPLALGLVQALNTFGGALPASLQSFAAPLAAILSMLAGVVEPEPIKAIVPTEGTPAESKGPTAQVAVTCSLADRARGLC